ncbi:MAG: LysM peptidoglycan-binding domain-containing protein [Lachnospiraceae bacterium]|nr:LysM peptidoglycan-binding domain-containing protein [Lachnospiraceae bacterium]
MIEIVCKEGLQEEKKEGSLCLPKNIRQIGSPGGRHKIYIEDYVYTYLRAMAQKEESCAAVFLGRSQMMKEIRYTFVSGAVECKAAIFQWDHIRLDDNFWEYIEEEKKEYFQEKEIVGWFLGKKGQAMSLSPAVEGAHRKYFAGRDKILMLLDIMEEEEAFFIYDQGYLQRREGYYIYYEKNAPMQEYMISKRQEEQRSERLLLLGETAMLRIPEEVKKLQSPEKECKKSEKKQEEWNNVEASRQGEPAHTEASRQGESAHAETEYQEELEELYEDQKQGLEEIRTGCQRQETEFLEGAEKIFAKSNLEEPKTQAEEALESYRYMILERQGRQIERQNRKFLYTAASFFLVIVCVIGITTINNYRKMQEVEDVLHVMKDSETEKKRSESRNGVVVESVESQVSPLKEGESAESPKNETSSKTSQKEEENQQNSSEVSGENGEVQEENTAEPVESENTSEENPAESEKSENDQNQDKPQEARYYTVKSGDTLASICINIYHDKDMMKKVCEANGIENGDKIYAGQKLLLP